MAAADMVRSGLASPSDFRLLLGLAGWAPQQLSAEIASGVWHCVAASKSLVMAPEGEARTWMGQSAHGSCRAAFSMCANVAGLLLDH